MPTRSRLPTATLQGEALIGRARRKGGELDWETFADVWFQVAE
jgi:hypothetical protein